MCVYCVGESSDQPEISEIESFLEEVSKVFIYENSGDTDFKKTRICHYCHHHETFFVTQSNKAVR